MHPAAVNEHTIYIWDAHELAEEMRKTREGARTAVEYNERLKAAVDADAVALAQLIQSGSKIARQIRLLGIMGRAYVKEAAGKIYIIFMGDARLRPNLSGTRYLAENAKVRCFVVGSKDIVADAGKATKIAIVAFIAIDVIAEVTSDHPSMASLGVRVGSDLLQAALAASAGVAAGVVLATVGAPVVITFIVVTAVGFAVGALLAEVDRRWSLTSRARARMMAFEAKELPIIRQEARAAVAKVETYGRQIGDAVAAEWYRVDRYYQSLALLMADQPPAPRPVHR